MSIKLPNGQMVEVWSWTRESLYGAFVVSLDTPVGFNLFDGGRAEPLIGAPDEYTSRLHTSLPRSSLVGLPMGWSFFVTSWRFAASRPLTEELLAWAAEVHVEFIYNHKVHAVEPLLALLHGTRTIAGDDPWGRPMDEAALVAFIKEWQLPLSLPTLPLSLPTQLLPVWLRENLSFEVRVEASTRALEPYQALLESLGGKRLMLWGYLDGYMKRSIP